MVTRFYCQTVIPIIFKPQSSLLINKQLKKQYLFQKVLLYWIIHIPLNNAVIVFFIITLLINLQLTHIFIYVNAGGGGNKAEIFMVPSRRTMVKRQSQKKTKNWTSFQKQAGVKLSFQMFDIQFTLQ